MARPCASAPPTCPTSCARSTRRTSRSSTCSCTLRRSATCSLRRRAAPWRARATPKRRRTRTRGGAGDGMNATLATQIGELARRSIARTMRQPAQIVPALVFPLFLLAVNTGGLNNVTKLPGFPTDSYLTFALSITFMQGAMFALMNAGTNLAADVETGFLNRLALTPLRGSALLTGMLAGVLVLGFVQAATFLLVGLTAGAHISAGVGGVLVIFALSFLMTLGFGAIGSAAALRTGSGEAVQGLFPLFFVLLFLSSMSLPRELIQTDWFREIATWNPVSYLIEAVRSLLITGWDGRALALGFAVAVGLVAVGTVLASLALRTRLVRT